MIVLHNTDGSYNGAVSWLTDPKSKVSAHLVISRWGEVTQIGEFTDSLWHCGGQNDRSIGIEIEANVVLKATKVDGVYTADPMLDPKAELYDHLTYDEVLDKKLGVMDLTAICICREHSMPLRVFRMSKQGALLNLVVGGSEGTLIEEGE